MSTTRENWNERQIKYIQFLGRGKRTKQGEKRTNEQFAQAIGVNPDTLYEWKRLPGFKLAVLEETVSDILDDLPMIMKTQAAKAAGQEIKNSKGKTLKPDTPAFLAIMRQLGTLQSDKIDHTTNGKDMPAPILGGATKGE